MNKIEVRKRKIMESGKRRQDNNKVKGKNTFPVPLSFEEIKDHINSTSISNSKLSKEKIIQLAFKFHSEQNFKEAAKYYQLFIDEGFTDPRVFNNYGVICQQSNNKKKAFDLYNRSIQLYPKSSDSFSNFGCLMNDIGKKNQAEYFLEKSIKINSNNAESYYNLGNIKRDLGKTKEALECYQKAIKLNFKFAKAYNNTGYILNKLNLHERAESSIRKAIKFKPNFAEAHCNLGGTLKSLERLKEAEISIRKAIELNPDYSTAYFNLGTILLDKGDLKEAEKATLKAIELQPNYADAFLCLGIIFKVLENYQDAEVAFRKAIALNANFSEAHQNLFFILLKCKKFTEGWEEYSWRWKIDRKVSIGSELKTNQPEWNLSQRGRVLLWREQGVGDEIYFSSLIPDFLDKVDQLILNIDVRLVPLLRRTFGDKIEYIDDDSLLNTNDYDFHIAMGSLPKLLRPSLNSFHKCKKFRLKVDIDKSQKLRSKLLDNRYEKLVGISWKSKSTNQPNKSMHLEEFILGINSPGIKFICLQYGEVKDEIFDLKKRHNINIFEVEEIDNFKDIDGLASLISACDEVVTTNNMTVHLSGAIGVKTNVLLDLTCGWEYGIDDEKSYWFPSVKLFRQESSGEWANALDLIQKEISLS